MRSYDQQRGRDMSNLRRCEQIDWCSIGWGVTIKPRSMGSYDRQQGLTMSILRRCQEMPCLWSITA